MCLLFFFPQYWSYCTILKCWPTVRSGFLCLNPLVPTSKLSLDLKSDNNYYFNLGNFVLTIRNNILKYDNNPDNFRVFKNWWHGCNSQLKLVWLLGKCNFSFVSSSSRQTVVIFLPFFLVLFLNRKDFLARKCSQVQVQYWYSYIYKYKLALNNLGMQFLLEQLVSGTAVQWEL